MPAFLQQVANYIKGNFVDFTDVCVVMPNRRAGLYLKKYLAESIDKPVFAPDIFSVEDFFIKISGLQIIDPIGLLFEFYEVHREVEKKHVQPFDEFIKWANVLLADFNEIDAHLVDAKKLFTYLNEVKAIEKWNPNGQQLTEAEREYLAFYNSLFDYYRVLKKNLEQKNTAYQGMVWRKLAMQPDLLKGLPWEKILFAGFNALTKSEEVIIGNLKQSGIAEILWDADEYYVFDKQQEAGKFIRKYYEQAESEKFRWTGTYFKDTKKDITITGVPKNVGQARFAASVIKDWKVGAGEITADVEKNVLDNTALVLADENLLMPVLNSLPDDLGDFNVTMGLPIRQTNLYQLLAQVIRLYENAERFGRLEDDVVKGFYYFDLLKLFQQPWFSYMIEATDLVYEIKLSNRVFYTPAHIFELLDKHPHPNVGLFKKIFREISPGPRAVIDLLSELLGTFRDKMIEIKNTDDTAIDTELEHLFHFSKIIKRLRSLIDTYNFIKTAKTLREIFNAIAGISRIPFYGEPLKGLQVMGMLETRNLDFDKLIILSVNEGTLPALGFGNSTIPYDIQNEFGLPTFQEKNAVFAYHFYRLIQRAGEVHLVYNTEANDIGGGEKSRFIQQMLHEMPGYNPKIKFTEKIESLSAPEKAAVIPIKVDKTDEVFQKLITMAQKGLSPTTINRYRRCALQFYLQDIVRLDESEEVEETLEARTIGIIVHDALEKLYQLFEGREIFGHDIIALEKKLEDQLADSFLKHYAQGEIRFGKNRLIFEVIRKFMDSFFRYEKKFLKELEAEGSKLAIRKLEEKIEVSVKLPSCGQSVKLKGTIDRVDELNGVPRIIDYKTGVVEPRELSLAEWEDFWDGNKLDKAFQVLMYAWLYQRFYKVENPKFETGVISMRKLSNGFVKFGIKPEGTRTKDTLIDGQVLQQFEQYLEQVLEELFDKGIPFEQTKDVEVCERCNFNNLCSRIT